MHEKNEMIKKGLLVEAVDTFFAPNASSHDFDGMVTKTKQEMISKMNRLLGGIAKVNVIHLHHALSTDNVSFAEFTFDLDMKDGSKIFWHEIIRSVWEDSLVVDEEYFISKK
jgi:hypothetical protein